MNECDKRWRVRFDADVTLVGGGGLQARGFSPRDSRTRAWHAAGPRRTADHRTVETGGHLPREASRAHRAPGAEFAGGRISVTADTGTSLDSPHGFGRGQDR